MGVQEKSLKVYDTRKTFFTRLSTTFSKIFGSSKSGSNNFLVKMKRNTAIKTFKHYEKATEEKEEILEKTFENAFTVYLESVDEITINSIYKRVTLGTASPFEREALSKYYTVIHTKEEDLDEYKIKKQIYLLDLDYNLLKDSNKTSKIQEFMDVYLYKMEQFYKSLLKHYSMLLTEKNTEKKENSIYDSIFSTLGSYVEHIIPMQDTVDEELARKCSEYETYSVGKLDNIDIIDKNLILLAISRKKFIHSLPLVVAERCYNKLLNDSRNAIVESRVERKKESAYQIFLKTIEEYDANLLSVKIYWDKPEQKKEYNTFKNKLENLKKIKETKGFQVYEKQKQILYIRTDLVKLETNLSDNREIVNYFRKKLVSLGDMKQLKNFLKLINGRFYGVKLQKGVLESEQAC